MSLVAIRLNSLHFKLEYTIHIWNIGQKNLSQVEKVVLDIFSWVYMQKIDNQKTYEDLFYFLPFSIF